MKQGRNPVLRICVHLCPSVVVLIRHGLPSRGGQCWGLIGGSGSWDGPQRCPPGIQRVQLLDRGFDDPLPGRFPREGENEPGVIALLQVSLNRLAVILHQPDELPGDVQA